MAAKKKASKKSHKKSAKKSAGGQHATIAGKLYACKHVKKGKGRLSCTPVKAAKKSSKKGSKKSK